MVSSKLLSPTLEFFFYYDAYKCLDGYLSYLMHYMAKFLVLLLYSVFIQLMYHVCLCCIFLSYTYLSKRILQILSLFSCLTTLLTSV